MSIFTERGDTLRSTIFSTALAKTGLSNMAKYGVFRGIFETLYKLFDAALGTIDTLADQRSIETATGTYLGQWGILCGVSRQLASKTVGKVTVKAYDAGSVPEGSWIAVDGTDLRLKATADTAFAAGTFLLPVEAEFAGIAYNIAEGTALSFTRVISGIESATAATGWIETPGEDEEDDDSLRARIKDKWRSLGEGSSPSRYAYLAASVTGVAEAKVVRTPRGYGTVDVVVASSDGIPSSELLASVRSALVSAGLLCYDLQVVAPTAVSAAISIEYSGDVAKATVEAAIRNYVLGLSLGGRLAIRDLYGTAIDGLTFTTFEVLTPDRDIEAGTHGKIIPTVTATKVSA